MSSNNTMAAGLTFGLIAVLMTPALLGGCNISDSEVNRVLSIQGITNVRTEGHAWFSCGKGDSFSTRFTGKAPNGRTVTGAVCGGWLKNYTVRFD